VLAGGVAHAGEVADAVNALGGAAVIQEKITLRELGITQPVELSASAPSHDFYLPVPAGVPLIEPSLSLQGHYLRADGGQTTYTLALDGNVVAARSLSNAEGDTNIDIGVDGTPRPTGFVRMGVAWSSATGSRPCDPNQPIGNVLEISPDSMLEYGYDPASVKNIAGAWSAMTSKVSLLVASDAPDSGSYDAAWRLGVALERAGKDVRIVTLPRQGSEIDVTGLEIPPALASVPAFAALAQGGRVTIGNAAEVGALILLGAPQARADVAVADPALAAELRNALDAVKAELAQADGDASAAVEALTARKDTLLNPVAARSVNVLTLGGRPVIAVAPDAAKAAVGLFDTLWRNTALASRLIVNAAGEPVGDANSVQLGTLDQDAGNLDVVAQGDWTTTFDLNSSLARGKVPTGMDIDVAAAPGATPTLPVASVFVNGFLLGAKRLTADGHPEHIAVSIPSYALQPRNTVRVEFQRQPASYECRELPQAFPVAVLPDSTIFLGAAPAPRDFAGLVPWLAGDAVVMAPDAWRNEATKTLPTLIHVADAAGISPGTAAFSLVSSNATVAPQKPFLAFDVPIDGTGDTVKVSGQRVSIADKKGKVFYDVSGLDRVAVLQAVTDAKQPGISYQSVGNPPQFVEPFRLPQGDIAVLGSTGVLAAMNSSGAPLYLDADGTQTGLFTWRQLLTPSFWINNISWLFVLVIGRDFVLLLLLARHRRKRHDGGS
jgi:hypothetical protein